MTVLYRKRRSDATLLDVGESIDELDIALLDALHLNPRVSFEELARVLDVSAVTAARRWHRSSQDGRPWVSSAPGPRLGACGGLFEAECAPGQAEAVADELARLPQVFSVHMTTGQHNVYALVAAADQTLLNGLLVDRLPAVHGIRSLVTARMVHLFSGTRWRLGGINATQAKAVTEDSTVAVAHHTFDDFDGQLYLTLQHDGRLGLRDLAARIDRSPAAVRRRLGILTQSRLLAFRTDFARPAAGWPTNVVLKLRIGEAVSVSNVGRALVQWPEIRVCADLVGGAANLFVTAQLHDLSALDELITRLHVEFPGVTVIDQRVLLRAVKSFGRLLRSDGRAQDVVPVDLWASTA